VVPQILSGTEVARLLAAPTSPKTGPRVGEITTLDTSDIDSQRMLIRVRDGKTGQRHVMLSPRVLVALRTYWKAYRPPGTELFPGYAKPRAGTQLSRESIHRVLGKAAREAGIHKRVSPHTLRHCFATPLNPPGRCPSPDAAPRFYSRHGTPASPRSSRCRATRRLLQAE
jgi:integrase/recombinase XerD